MAGGCGEVITGGVPAGFGLRTRRCRVVTVVSEARTVRGVGRVGYENAGAVLVPAAGCRVWGSGQVRRVSLAMRKSPQVASRKSPLVAM